MLCMNCWAGTAQDQSTICDRCEERLIRARGGQRAEIPNRAGVERSLKLGGLIFVALLLFCSAAPAADLPEAAVVPVQITEPQCSLNGCERVPVSRGSAVIFSDAVSTNGTRGWALLTAKHVVKVSNTARIEVYLDGRWVTARARNFSKYADLAVITAPSPNAQVLACLSASDPSVGDEVQVGGYVLGREFQRRKAKVRISQQTVNSLTAEHAIIPGDSGGGVFDRQGNLCGIVFAHEEPSPWQANYVGLTEVRRFLSIAWSPSYAAPPLRTDGPEPKSAPTPAKSEPQPSKTEPEQGTTDAIASTGSGAPVPATAGPELQPGRSQPTLAEPDSETPVDAKATEGSAEPAPVINFGKSLGPVSVLKPDSVSGVGKHQAAETPSSRVTMKKNTGNQASVSERVASWWDLGQSTAVLVAAIAGGMATGGVGWLALVRPAVREVAALRAVIHTHHATPNRSVACPPIVTMDSPPGPQVVTTSTQVAPYQVDHVSEALAFAVREIVRKYPGSVDTVETLKSLVNQYLASKGLSVKV